MRRRNPGRTATVKLALLLTAVFLIAAYANPVHAQDSINVPVTLTDSQGIPISKVRLTAWRVGISKSQSSGCTAKNGMALFHLPAGRYYFTADISGVKTTGTDRHAMTRYFISKPREISENANNISLVLDNVNYIDVTDIGGLKEFELIINQQDLGIKVPLRIGQKSVRLYLPTRFVYTLQDPQGIQINWPVYAVPGMKLVISGS